MISLKEFIVKFIVIFIRTLPDSVTRRTLRKAAPRLSSLMLPKKSTPRLRRPGSAEIDPAKQTRSMAAEAVMPRKRPLMAAGKMK